MFVTAAGMSMALLVDVLIAARLGISAAADALIIALSLPLLIDVSVREGTKFSLLSLFVEMQHELSMDEYRRVFGGLLNLFLTVGLGCTLLGWLLAPLFISALGPGLELDGRLQATRLLRICIPLVMFAMGSSILGVHLNSQRRFVLVSFRNVFAPSVVVLAMAMAWDNSNFTMWIAGAYTVGYGLFFGFLLFFSGSQVGLSPVWRAWPDRNTLSRLWQAIIYPVFGFGATQGLRAIERALASMVASGGVSTYYFAFRLVSAIQTIVGVSVATVGLPQITQYDLSGEEEKFNKALKRQAGRVTLLSLPITLGVLIFNRPMVQLLYGRGAFDATSIEQTGLILKYLGVGIVFLCLAPVLNSGLYAQRRFSWVLYGMIILTVVNTFLAWGLGKLWGLSGIAAAASLSLAIVVSVLWFLVRLGQKFNHVESP
jgi:murein biosynthesis integral membrane protein MurJ